MKNAIGLLVLAAERLEKRATDYQAEALRKFIFDGRRLCDEWPGESTSDVARLRSEAIRLLVVAHSLGVLRESLDEETRRD